MLEKRKLCKNVRLSDPADIETAQLFLGVGDNTVQDLSGNQYYSGFVKLLSECIEPNSKVERIYGIYGMRTKNDASSAYVSYMLNFAFKYLCTICISIQMHRMHLTGYETKHF